VSVRERKATLIEGDRKPKYRARKKREKGKVE
jgi:hypothetical protein